MHKCLVHWACNPSWHLTRFGISQDCNKAQDTCLRYIALTPSELWSMPVRQWKRLHWTLHDPPPLQLCRTPSCFICGDDMQYEADYMCSNLPASDAIANVRLCSSSGWQHSHHWQ